MIYCPQCGTANRDGSKYCNECGNRLVSPPPVEEEPRGEEAPPRLAEVLDAEVTSPYDEAAFGPIPIEEEPEEAEPLEEEREPEEAEGRASLPEAAELPTEAVQPEGEVTPEPEEIMLPPEPIAPQEAEPPRLAEELPTEAEPDVVGEVKALAEEEVPVVVGLPAASPLAGIADPIPIAPSVAARHRLTESEPLVTPLVEIAEARLLAEIAGPPAPPEPATPAEPLAWDRDQVRRWLVYLMMLLAVTLPLIVVRGPVAAPSESPITEGVFQAVEELPEGALVLVSFDYDPGVAGEMDLLAEALVEHLMRRGARLAVMSLSPEGAALAQQILDEGVARHAAYVYGQSTLHLGYLPGEEAALRSLALDPRIIVERDYVHGRPLSDWPLAQDLRVDRVALIVELAGGPRFLRQWIEQVQRAYGSPMVAGVSAAVEPHAWPYYLSGQLRGMVSGLPGASQYDALLRRPTGNSSWLAAQSVAHLALIALIILAPVSRWLATRRS